MRYYLIFQFCPRLDDRQTAAGSGAFLLWSAHPWADDDDDGALDAVVNNDGAEPPVEAEANNEAEISIAAEIEVVPIAAKCKVVETIYLE